ncbi:hypothetical protein TEK04_16790 [Klenkia sp. LSe6-5]|uniref:Uncharacterized protein n=1 Tax=Klenkia sesuvii TaxID=3103137 RepID=A0ABU8DX12_9ACTN
MTEPDRSESAPDEEPAEVTPQALVDTEEKSMPGPGDMVDRAEFSQRDDGDVLYG